MRLSIRVFSPAILLMVLLATAFSSPSQCVIPSSLGSNADETAAHTLLNQVVVDAPTCPAVTLATSDACNKRKQELSTLRTAAIGLKAADSYCVSAGKDTSNKPLTDAVKASYAAHEDFWATLVTQIPAADNGTFVIPGGAAPYLNLPAIALPIPPPTAPTTSTKIMDGTTVLQVQAQNVDANYLDPAKLQVCVFAGSPPADPDCTPNSPPDLTPSLLMSTDGKSKVNFVNPDPKSGSIKITLATAISGGDTVYIVEHDTDKNGGNQPAVLSKPYKVTVIQCNTKHLGNSKHQAGPYSDCDWDFSIIGGIEQSGLAAEATQTEGFLRVFTRAGWDNNLQVFGAIRLLGAPAQSSANGVVSAFANPTGSITTQSLTSVGYAIDYSLGFETLPWFKGNRSYSFSAIGEFGGTTPLNSSTIAAAYKAPAFGTVECGQLYNRFLNYFTADGIALGTGTNATPPSGSSTTASCLVNTNDPTTSSSTTTYAPINNIGFSNQDRSAFLGKWFVGARFINRFPQKNAVACGRADPANGIAPCARGIVDALFGADASINRGVFRPWVFKVEAVHPLPIKGTSYLYIFGSFSVRMAHNINQTPLVLQTGDLSGLTGTGSTAVPNVNTVVLPLTQPGRDFYRFGLGLDISCIFTKVFGSTSDCSGFASTGSSASGSSTSGSSTSGSSTSGSSTQ